MSDVTAGILSQGCDLGVRGQWPAGLIEQAELGLRLHARGVNLVEGEVDGYVIGPFGAVAIRVVRDVPGAASNLALKGRDLMNSPLGTSLVRE